MAASPRNPASPWRVLAERGVEAFAENRGDFDELCVGGWLHLERMSYREWWLQLGACIFWIKIHRNGRIEVKQTETRPECEYVDRPRRRPRVSRKVRE